MNIFFVKGSRLAMDKVNSLIEKQNEIIRINEMVMDRMSQMATEIKSIYGHELNIQNVAMAELSHPGVPNTFPMAPSLSNRITSTFGPRTNPFRPNTGSVKNFEEHDGIDIAGPYGAIVESTMEGIVKEHWPVRPGYTGHPTAGGYIIVYNEKTGYETHYAHLMATFIREGQRVYPGTKLGKMGDTGRTTGVHLHYAIYRNGKPINPLGLMGITSQLDVKMTPEDKERYMSKL